MPRSAGPGWEPTRSVTRQRARMHGGEGGKRLGSMVRAITQGKFVVIDKTTLR
jgi:hypothetical protein